MIASSRVASSSPFGARRASGCLATLSQSLPFVQAHDPSAFAHHAGNTDHPYAAYLRAVDASADAAAGNGVTPSPVSLRQQSPSIYVYPSSAPPSLAPPSPPGGTNALVAPRVSRRTAPLGILRRRSRTASRRCPRRPSSPRPAPFSRRSLPAACPLLPASCARASAPFRTGTDPRRVWRVR